MSAATIRRRLIVHGEVQGVLFREATRAKADNEGVFGWIANRGDGAVEAVLEGPEPAVEAVAQFCRVGPARARVARVQESDESPEGLHGFEVR